MALLDPGLLYAVLAVLPPAAVFFAAYGKYDGAFRDNVVFLYFLGGLGMGFVLGFLSIVALGGLAPLMTVILLAALYPVSLVVGINRRKWQGERHAVFNGGAFGLGVSLMLGFTFLYVLFARRGITASNAMQALLLCVGVAGVLFGLGLLAGNGVRLRTPFRGALLGSALLLVPAIFLVSFVGNVSPPAAQGAPGPWVASVEGTDVAAPGGAFEGARTFRGLVEGDVANATLRLVNATGHSVTARPAADGTFAFERLAPGRYRLEAWAETDGGSGPGPEEARGVLLDAEGREVFRNEPVVGETDLADHRVELRAPPPGGWLTRERLLAAAETPPDTLGAWLWSTLLAAFGLVFAVAAERRVLIEGVSDEARRQRRRLRRSGN